MSEMATLLGSTGLISTINPGLYDDRSGQVIGASIALLVLPTIAVALRLASRWISRAGFWYDDYSIILAMFLSWGPNIVILVSVHHGFGKHVQVLPVSTIFTWFKFLYSFEFLYTLAMASVKYSIILFQYRIFPIVQFRRVLIGVLAFVIALTISCVLVSIFQCIPIHNFWDTLGGSLTGKLGGRCIQVQNYFLISGSINAVTDFILLALPIPILWRLRTGKPQKLLLTGIFTIGLTVCAVSIVRLILLSQINPDDITYNYVPTAIWTAAEPSIAVVSACLPSLRPLFVRLIFQSSHRTIPPYHSKTTSPWRSSGGKGESSSFNRLQEQPREMHDGTPWSNSVAVCGGKELGDDYELSSERGAGEVPVGRIRAKTTVVLTVSERVDWKDELF